VLRLDGATRSEFFSRHPGRLFAVFLPQKCTPRSSRSIAGYRADGTDRV